MTHSSKRGLAFQYQEHVERPLCSAGLSYPINMIPGAQYSFAFTAHCAAFRRDNDVQNCVLRLEKDRPRSAIGLQEWELSIFRA
jgi:hypothetical protein